MAAETDERTKVAPTVCLPSITRVKSIAKAFSKLLLLLLFFVFLSFECEGPPRSITNETDNPQVVMLLMVMVELARKHNRIIVHKYLSNRTGKGESTAVGALDYYYRLQSFFNSTDQQHRTNLSRNLGLYLLNSCLV